jgi:hypothetical protein
MSNPTPIKVIVDDRIRIMSAALAATNFPQSAQERKRHHAHAHARALIKHLSERDMKKHPAIVAIQGLLDEGTPLEALFTLVMSFQLPKFTVDSLPQWLPAGLNTQLWDFYEKAELAAFFEDGSKVWESAEAQSKHVFEKVYFKETLAPFLGDVSEELMFMPNILWPADRELGIRVDNQLIAIVPPALAWGESPPWPFDEESMVAIHVYPGALSQYARILLQTYLHENAEKVSVAVEKELPVGDLMAAEYPSWEEQFIALFKSAVVAIYLEDFMNPTEARGYILMEKKVHNMTILPGTISVLRRFLQEKGNRYETLADFLTVFPAQLRVAKRIITM